jgi:hypothetical protein
MKIVIKENDMQGYIDEVRREMGNRVTEELVEMQRARYDDSMSAEMLLEMSFLVIHAMLLATYFICRAREYDITEWSGILIFLLLALFLSFQYACTETHKEVINNGLLYEALSIILAEQKDKKE